MRSAGGRLTRRRGDVVVLGPDVVPALVQRLVQLVEVRLELLPRRAELVGVGALPDCLVDVAVECGLEVERLLNKHNKPQKQKTQKHKNTTIFTHGVSSPS